MRRHQALIPLSHDHQHGLAAALRLRRSAEAAGPGFAAEVARFNHAARRELLPHFEDEEAAIAPLLVTGDSVLVTLGVQLAQEHAALRAAFARLEQVARAEAFDEAVALDAATDCARLLTEHIRWEERELFTAMQDALADADLDALQLPARDTEYAAGGRLELRRPDVTSGVASEQLNATPIDLEPGQVRAPWVADRDVALVVMRGDLTLTVDGHDTQLAAPTLVLVPSGSTRALRGGRRGAVAVSVHTARGALEIAGRGATD